MLSQTNKKTVGISMVANQQQMFKSWVRFLDLNVGPKNQHMSSLGYLDKRILLLNHETSPNRWVGAWGVKFCGSCRRINGRVLGIQKPGNSETSKQNNATLMVISPRIFGKKMKQNFFLMISPHTHTQKKNTFPYREIRVFP